MQRKTFKKKKKGYYKPCYFTKNRISYIDYKDTELLKNYISINGRILSSYITGVKPRYQRMLSNAIKRARFMGLFPYVIQKQRKLQPNDSERTNS